MIEIDDSDFFTHREATQRRLAARAVDPSIAAVHTQLADQYAARILRDKQPLPQIFI